MGSVPQAIDALSTYLNEPLPRAKQISRHLMDGELLPKSAGKRIEQISDLELAVFLIALSTAKRPADAPRSAITWGSMTPNGKLWSPEERAVTGDKPKASLLQFISILIRLAWEGNGAGPLANAICASTLEITTTCPHAIIEFDGRRTEYLPTGGEVPIGRQRVDRIPGATIHQLAMVLREGAPIPEAMPAEFIEGFLLERKSA